MLQKRGRLVLIVLLFVLLLSPVQAPPTPRSVRGIVYYYIGAMVESGFPVFINDTNTSYSTMTQTYGPPGYEGGYAAFIYANTNDLILARSWNKTHYGESNGSMGSTSLVLNIYLDNMRDSEANVTITYPANHTVFEAGVAVNITGLFNMLGHAGTNCQVDFFFNQSMFNLYHPTTISLGSVAIWDTIPLQWNTTTNLTGTTNMTLHGYCDSDGFNIHHLDWYKVVNITVQDTLPPVIRVRYPGNNTRVNYPVTFIFNVTDGSLLRNCSLAINDAVVNTTENPLRFYDLDWTHRVPDKYNQWHINCTDIFNNTGTSGIFNLTINDVPGIWQMFVDDPIDLVAATTKRVTCNGTVYDGDGWQDIANISAELVRDGYSFFGAPDNTSSHYTNSSCSLFNPSGNNLDFTCSFDLQYNALNGSWTCNATALDLINATNSSTIGTTVNQLIAIDVNPLVIDYGQVEIMKNSPDITINVTNYGNVRLDLELYGWAVYEADEMGLTCEISNITLPWERFSLSAGTSYPIMTSLGPVSSPNSVSLQLPPQGNENLSTAPVYWKIRIPEFTGGLCNGKAMFTAVLG